MDEQQGYGTDLAFVHDEGFGDFARRAAPGLLRWLREAGILDGIVVDLGCGSGIWARELLDAGYQVVGVDLSAAMIELARRRAPEAELHVGSFLRFPWPPCRAVTAIGEVFNYLFDPDHSLQSLDKVCRDIFAALAPGGLLIFDVAEPGRCRGRTQAFTEAQDWTCLVEYQHDEPRHRLTRRIVTFRRVGECFRRGEETHPQQLFEEDAVVTMLTRIGFEVQPARAYGEYPLAEHVVGIVARRPAP